MDDLKYIIKDAADIFQTTPAAIAGTSRKLPNPQARHAIMLVQFKQGQSKSHIARSWGYDWASAHHGIRAAKDRLDVDTGYTEETRRLVQRWAFSPPLTHAPRASEIYITVNAG